MKLKIIYQYDTSSINLEGNGKESLVIQTRHCDIKYLYVTDLVVQKEVNIEYCPTSKIIVYYMTKPLVSGKFILLCDMIMNISGKNQCIGQQECFG